MTQQSQLTGATTFETYIEAQVAAQPWHERAAPPHQEILGVGGGAAETESVCHGVDENLEFNSIILPLFTISVTSQYALGLLSEHCEF
eukprot:2621367-Amphidinium_carterae.2